MFILVVIITVSLNIYCLYFLFFFVSLLIVFESTLDISYNDNYANNINIKYISIIYY